MVKEEWCIVSPMSGQGDGVLTVSAAPYTGRVTRMTTVTVRAENGTHPTKSFTVTQQGPGVVLTLDSNIPNLPKTGGKVTFNGTSNSATLKFQCGQATAGLVGTLKMEGKEDVMVIFNETFAKTVTIQGDPGMVKVYSFTLELEVAASKSATKRTFKISVTPSDETLKKICSFTVEPGESSLTLSRVEARMNKEGKELTSGSNTVRVTSNDNWTVS